jgi:hypothetical protein
MAKGGEQGQDDVKILLRLTALFLTGQMPMT